MELSNDVNKLKQIDVSDMIGLVMRMPDHIVEAIGLAETLKLPKNYYLIKNIVITGLGGSAIGGDLLRCYLNNEIKIPIVVNRNYTLPNWVNEETLVFVASYSGNTEETISACKIAVDKKAKIITITSNGKIKEMSKESEIPCVQIPSGISPRAAIAYLFFPMLLIVCQLKLVSSKKNDVRETLDVLKKIRNIYKPQIATLNNPAKQLANSLFTKAIIIYGVSDFTEVVSTRWKCQFSENSKIFSVSNVLPEMNHNEIVAWDLLKKVLRKFAVIFLRDRGDSDRLIKRIEITKNLIKKRANYVGEVKSIGESPLARLFSLIYLGDFVSVYLSILYGVDPTPVKAIDYLKKELSK